MIRAPRPAEQSLERRCPEGPTSGILTRFAERNPNMRVILATLALGLAILGGCGQMGPLYMPEETAGGTASGGPTSGEATESVDFSSLPDET